MDSDLFHKQAGERVLFKAVNIHDTPEIHKFASDEEVSRFIGWRLMNDLNETREHVEEMLKREALGTHMYASVVNKVSNEIMGTAMLFNFDKETKHAEIGYVLRKDSWGMGFGTEVVRLVQNFAFGILGLHKLHARVVEANTGSYRILEKNGFVLEGRFKDYYFIEGSYYDGLFLGRING